MSAHEPGPMAPRRLALLLAVVLTAGPAATAAAAPAGTLDRLVDAFDRAASRALAGSDLAEIDLAVWIGSAPGVKAELSAVVSDLLVARLGSRGLRSVMRIAGEGSPAARRAHARSAGCERLLTAEVVLGEGHLHLKGVLLDTERNLWRDVLRPDRGALHHLHAQVRMDAEIRAYQGGASAGPPRFAPRGFGVAGDRILDLAVVDLDGDGRREVAALHRRVLRLYTFDGGAAGFREVHVLELTPPWAGARPRRAVGTLLAVDRDGDGREELVVRTSEMPRGALVALDAGKLLTRRADLDGYPQALAPGGTVKQSPWAVAQLAEGTDLFDPRSLDPPLPPPLQQGLSAAFYRMKALVLPVRKSGPVIYRGVLDDKGDLHVYRGGSPNMVAYLQRVGIAFELLDLDDDGVLDLVTTGSGPPGAPDRVAVHRVSNLATPLWQSGPLQGVITALAHGDIDGDGKLEVIAAVEDSAGKVELRVLN